MFERVLEVLKLGYGSNLNVLLGKMVEIEGILSGEGWDCVAVVRNLVWNALGNLHAKIGNSKQAFAYLQKAVKILPQIQNENAGVTYLNLCKFLLKRKK